MQRLSFRADILCRAFVELVSNEPADCLQREEIEVAQGLHGNRSSAGEKW